MADLLNALDDGTPLLSDRSLSERGFLRDRGSEALEAHWLFHEPRPDERATVDAWVAERYP
jgi:hypothetical protein